jgi:hypothetical protein
LHCVTDTQILIAMKNILTGIARWLRNGGDRLHEKFPFKPVFLISGILATTWFLVRVIPKPSRAGYPCMRAAAPLMSGFVLYLLSFSSSFFAFRKAKVLIGKKSFFGAAILTLCGIIAGSLFFVLHDNTPAHARIMIMSNPEDGANNPAGEAVGIFPGRVVWAWDPEATSPATDNTPGNAFWDVENNDTAIIRRMVGNSILKLTGSSDAASAWDSLFTHHNARKTGEKRGYQPGETVFIKINQGTSRWVLTADEKNNGYAWPESGGMSAIQPAWRQNHFAATETGPFVVLNLLRHLVNVAGVPEENIAIGDPMSHTFRHNFAVWYDEFPNVRYTDKFSASHNRTLIVEADEPSVEYSDQGEVLGETFEFLFRIMEEADYMINVACLKPHERAGITLCAKNHFGSITRESAGHLHPSLVAPDAAGQTNEGYGQYRVQVDIMAHKYLGGNTMLFVVEGLFGGGPSEVRPPRKWNMEPFGGNWTNSIFMSLDQVALESVCYDFLRTEFDGVNQPEAYPNWYGVDDYLHQAADPATRPSGLDYNPDGEGPVGSLGVHEHWNDPVNMQYSRNLETGNGIELVRTSGVITSLSLPAGSPASLRVYPNPFRDELILSFDYPGETRVTFRLFNMRGEQVRTSASYINPPGKNEIRWLIQTGDLPRGIYIIDMMVTADSGTFRESRRIQLTK